jgi:ferritin-like metal-binding protein YciE
VKLETLHQLYIRELRDLYDAEKQIIKALPKMVEMANSSDLRDALDEHLEQTRGHVTRLEQVLRLHNEDVKGEKCKGMEGIIDEDKNVMKLNNDANVGDAAIIAGAQKVEHYEMASYGSVRSWAQQMGHQEAAQLLQQTLEEEKEADRKLTEISSTLNFEAVRRAG